MWWRGTWSSHGEDLQTEVVLHSGAWEGPLPSSPDCQQSAETHAGQLSYAEGAVEGVGRVEREKGGGGKREGRERCQGKRHSQTFKSHSAIQF